MPFGIMTGAGKGIIILLGVGKSPGGIVSVFWSALGESFFEEQQLFLGFGGHGTDASVIGVDTAPCAFPPPQQEPTLGAGWLDSSITCVVVIEPPWLAIVVFELFGLRIGVWTCENIGYMTEPKGLSAGVMPMLPYGFISAMGVAGFVEASSKEGRMLSILGSIRCKAVGSTDSLRLELLPLELVFCTR